MMRGKKNRNLITSLVINDDARKNRPVRCGHSSWRMEGGEPEVIKRIGEEGEGSRRGKEGEGEKKGWRGQGAKGEDGLSDQRGSPHPRKIHPTSQRGSGRETNQARR